MKHKNINMIFRYIYYDYIFNDTYDSVNTTILTYRNMFEQEIIRYPQVSAAKLKTEGIKRICFI